MSLQYQILMISAITGYVIGSIPFGYILTKIFAKKDLTSIGSGGTGATNTLRAAGFLPAILTLILDAAKPVIAGLVAWKIIDNALGNLSSLIYIFGKFDELKTSIIALTGAFAVIGHCFSIFLKFSGGKGAASALGFALYVNAPIVGITTFGIWMALFFSTHFVSLATVSSLILYPVLAYFLESELYANTLYIVIFVCVFDIIMHGKNIKRLLTGKEYKVYLFKKNKDKKYD